MGTKRQAVVVLHGMGEQRAMGTLRPFVEAAIPRPEGDAVWYHSRPDKVLPGRFDLRRYLAPPPPGRPEAVQTELFEYHWAHLMAGNELSHLVPLLKRIFTRLPITRGFAILQAFATGLIVGLVALTVFFVTQTTRQLESLDVEGIAVLFGATGLWTAVFAQIGKFATNFAVGTLVDFARYTDSAPGNQKVRDDIRRGLVDMLEALHASGRYDRIVVAAHSLGSIVAYDAIAYLWPRLNKLHGPPVTGEPFSVADLVAVEDEACLLNTGSGSVEAYRAAQWAAWREQRQNGSPWLITDLVTFGSPMAQAGQLIANGKRALQDAFCRHELPRCPPQPDRLEFTAPAGDDSPCKTTFEKQKAAHDANPPKWHYWWECSANAPVLAHSAPFALVRWTNVRYRADWFAGPLAPLFGPGVKDLMAKGDGFLSRVPVWAHTMYLSYPHRAAPEGATARLRTGLDLDRRSELDFEAPETDETSAEHLAARQKTLVFSR